MDLEEIAKQYVDRKIRMTKCMQKHFRQLCSRCKKWHGCSIYLEYFDAWKALERKVNA